MHFRADTLRRAVQAAVNAGSLRSVAAQIGMSAPGLQHFLDGGVPRQPTLRKLGAWYVSREPSLRDHIPPEAAHAALGLLLADLPREGHDDAARELLDVISKHYLRFRIEPPAWALAAAG